MRKTQKSNGGAIGGDYSCDISEKWWYTATCEFITIPGGTTQINTPHWNDNISMGVFIYTHSPYPQQHALR